MTPQSTDAQQRRSIRGEREKGMRHELGEKERNRCSAAIMSCARCLPFAPTTLRPRSPPFPSHAWTAPSSQPVLAQDMAQDAGCITRWPNSLCEPHSAVDGSAYQPCQIFFAVVPIVAVVATAVVATAAVAVVFCAGTTKLLAFRLLYLRCNFPYCFCCCCCYCSCWC